MEDAHSPQNEIPLSSDEKSEDIHTPQPDVEDDVADVQARLDALRKQLDEYEQELDAADGQYEASEDAHEIPESLEEQPQAEEAFDASRLDGAFSVEELKQAYQDFERHRKNQEFHFTTRMQALQEWDEKLKKKNEDQKEIHRRQKRHNERIREAEAVLHARHEKNERAIAQIEERKKQVRSESKQAAEMKDRAREVVGLHQELLNAKRQIHAMEQRMIRKWATSKAITLIAAWLVCFTLIGTGSYIAGHRLNEPIYSAATEIERSYAETVNKDEFIEQQRDILLSQTVLNNTIKTMEQEQVIGPSTIDKLREILNKSLVLKPMPNSTGVFRIEIEHPNQKLLKPLLTALTSAYVIECLKIDHGHGYKDGGTTIKLQPAVSSEPVRDVRLRKSAIYFSISFAITITLVFISRILILNIATPETQDLENLVDETALGKSTQTLGLTDTPEA